MSMSFFFNGEVGEFECADYGNAAETSSSRTAVNASKDDLPLIAEKLRIPDRGDIVRRERLLELLERSRTQFGGTLVSGRSGTGKTALVADFASDRKKVAWYSVDPADSEWNVFARYFAAALAGNNVGAPVAHGTDPASLAEFLGESLSRKKCRKDLIVLDGIHHLFDSSWFCDFFVLFLQSLGPGCHSVMLCRSKPPAPLWRLRSKQVLNVIDERLLAFTLGETEALCVEHGLPETVARALHSESFGRAQKLAQLVGHGSGLSRRHADLR